MTSATDVNGRTTYYIYDDLNRLQLIKDQDGNIIKKICYNYAGQPGDCTVNTDPNWTATGNLRCETNGSGNTGYQEREEVDQNPNSATSNQTRWVINGYNTTACPLPAPPCTISMNYGFTNATNSIYNNGTSVQFYMAFYSNTVMNPGISYYVGNITGSCRPSSTRTINYSSSSQNWTITIEPSGVMYWYLNYGSTPVPAYSTIGTSTLTYNL
jgi:YD repeat-containing protein